MLSKTEIRSQVGQILAEAQGTAADSVPVLLYRAFGIVVLIDFDSGVGDRVDATTHYIFIHQGEAVQFKKRAQTSADLSAI